MSRHARDTLYRSLKRPSLVAFWRFFQMHKIGYCNCCGVWSWLTNGQFPYSAYDGYFLCEECTDENDEEWDRIWRDYYGGLL